MIWRLMILLAGVSSAQAAELVGTVVPPFPDGMYEQEGACFGSKPETPCEHNFGVLHDASEKKVAIYVGADAGHTASGKPQWRVLDILSYPKVNKGFDVVFAGCRQDGVEDGAIVALVRNSKQPWLKAAGWAYRVDSVTGKFVKADAKRIECVNTALDAD